MKNIKIKRAYDSPSADDDYRLLVDRLWPRGVSKEAAKLDEWDKEIAPSTELRKWYNHEEERFEEFAMRYRKELESKIDDLKRIKSITAKQDLCLVFSAKIPELSQAQVLLEVLNELKT